MTLRVAALTFGLLLCLAPGVSATEPVYLEIVTDQSFEAGDELSPFIVSFRVHANGNRIQGAVFVFFLNFSNGNIIGTMFDSTGSDAHIYYSAASNQVFETKAWNSGLGHNPTDPDTMLLQLVSFDDQWTGSGEMFRIQITPTDTGSISFDTCGLCFVPPTSHGGPAFQDSIGAELPLVIFNPTIHVPPKPGTVRFRMTTSTATDTIFFGNPATIHAQMDPSGQRVAGATMIFRWTFSNGHIIGPFSVEGGQVEFSTAAVSAFETLAWNGGFGSPTDTSLAGMVDFGGPGYSADAYPWSVTFTPSDTGTIFIHSGSDFTLPPACCGTAAQDSMGNYIPSNWIPVRIAVVPCPYALIGDVNQDTFLTSADIIYFVNYVFKSGPDPLPERSVGDVNCSGGLGSSDIIYLVNHVFKGGAAPCACIVRRI